MDTTSTEERACTGLENVEWRGDAAKFVVFDSREDKLGRVFTTLWIKPAAFKCVQTLEELRSKVLLFVSDDDVREIDQAGDEEDADGQVENALAFKGKKNSTRIKASVEKSAAENPTSSRKEITTAENPRSSEVVKQRNDSYQVRNIILYRWRRYEIDVTAQNIETGQKTKAVFEFNTLLWKCGKDSQKRITVTQLCDGKVDDCPNGEDEAPGTCKVTELPKKMSFLCYGLMVAVILLYFIYMRSKIIQPQGQHLEMITKKAFGKYHSQGNKSNFLARYRELHLEDGFVTFAEDLKYEIYQNPGEMNWTVQVSTLKNELTVMNETGLVCVWSERNSGALEPQPQWDLMGFFFLHQQFPIQQLGFQLFHFKILILDK